MRLSESPGATKDRFTLEALQKEEQENLKARMQIEMLKDQTRQQQAMLDTRQVKKSHTYRTRAISGRSRLVAAPLSNHAKSQFLCVFYMII